MALVQHAEPSPVICTSNNKRFRDVRQKRRFSYAKVLFFNFAVIKSEIHDTFLLGRRAEGNHELSLEMRSALLAFAYAKLFRVYHPQMTEPATQCCHRAPSRLRAM